MGHPHKIAELRNLRDKYQSEIESAQMIIRGARRSSFRQRREFETPNDYHEAKRIFENKNLSTINNENKKIEALNLKLARLLKDIQDHIGSRNTYFKDLGTSHTYLAAVSMNRFDIESKSASFSPRSIIYRALSDRYFFYYSTNTTYPVELDLELAQTLRKYSDAGMLFILFNSNDDLEYYASRAFSQGAYDAYVKKVDRQDTRNALVTGLAAIAVTALYLWSDSPNKAPPSVAAKSGVHLLHDFHSSLPVKDFPIDLDVRAIGIRWPSELHNIRFFKINQFGFPEFLN